jgi:hypothetical protein
MLHHCKAPKLLSWLRWAPVARYRSVGRAPTARSDVVVGEGCNHEGCEGGLGSEKGGGGAHKVVDGIHVQVYPHTWCGNLSLVAGALTQGDMERFRGVKGPGG